MTISSIVIGFEKLLLFTNLLAKLLSHSSISQSHSKFYFKSTNHIHFDCSQFQSDIKQITPPLSVF